jgi:hypothetical protein
MGEGDVGWSAEEKHWGKQSLAWPWGGVYERQENQLIGGLENGEWSPADWILSMAGKIE